MDDVYEIAQETAKAIEASRRFRASMTDDVEDEAREWPPIYHVCRALLAQKAVVEAAEELEDSVDEYGYVNTAHYSACADKVCRAVRAMKERTR